MKIVLALAVLLILAGIFVYAVGVRLPVDHSTTVTGVVPAPPAKVFSIITDIANGPTWRKQVQSVQVLPPEDGPAGKQDHWIEDLGHGNKMNFTAIRTEPPTPDGHALRAVMLNDKSAAYGGTWTYKLSPGPTPSQTMLSITEDGFIHPPIYRFMMVHVMGMTYNLDQYMKNLQTAATRP